MGRISREAFQGGRTSRDDDESQGSSAIPASATSLPCTSSLPEAAARRKRRRGRIYVAAGASRALHQPFHECTISWFLYLFCSSRSSRRRRKRRTTQEFTCKALPPSYCCSCSLFFCNNNRSRTVWARFFFFITPAQMELESSF